MTATKAAVVLGAVALLSAGAVALVSRAPGELRSRAPRTTESDAAVSATFTDEEVDRHAAYRGPLYLAAVLTIVLEIVTLIVVGLGPFRAIVARLDRVPGGWPVRIAIAAVVLTLIAVAVRFPLSFVRDFAIEHAWHRSTQDIWGWLADRGKSLVVGAVIAAIGAVVFFGLVRWQPRAWWLYAWGAFTVLSVLLVFLWPLAIAPLFNRFTPLQNESLATRARAMASEVGVDVDEVLVADASRRTTGENAYVAGLGGSKQLVLYDTLVRGSTEDEAAFVVAHELGHEAKGHVVKMLAITSAGLLAGLALLAWLAGRSGTWSWTGASDISDPRVLPALLLYVALATVVTLPLTNAISRAFEREADRVALELTDHPSVAVASFRRLAFSNLADLRPPAVAVWAFFSHPPIRERIESAIAVSGRAP